MFVSVGNWYSVSEKKIVMTTMRTALARRGRIENKIEGGRGGSWGEDLRAVVNDQSGNVLVRHSSGCCWDETEQEVNAELWERSGY